MSEIKQWPAWRYRKGESRIFNAPDDVPDDAGWVDHPDKIVDDQVPGRRGRKPKADVSDGDNNAGGDAGA